MRKLAGTICGDWWAGT